MKPKDKFLEFFKYFKYRPYLEELIKNLNNKDTHYFLECESSRLEYNLRKYEHSQKNKRKIFII